MELPREFALRYAPPQSGYYMQCLDKAIALGPLLAPLHGLARVAVLKRSSDEVMPWTWQSNAVD
jgi:hypothetical protein